MGRSTSWVGPELEQGRGRIGAAVGQDQSRSRAGAEPEMSRVGAEQEQGRSRSPILAPISKFIQIGCKILS